MLPCERSRESIHPGDFFGRSLYLGNRVWEAHQVIGELRELIARERCLFAVNRLHHDPIDLRGPLVELLVGERPDVDRSVSYARRDDQL